MVTLEQFRIDAYQPLIANTRVLLSAIVGSASNGPMAKKFPIRPKHPERVCWGCDKYCAAESLACGNGSDRTQHPVELLGDDWYRHGDWGLDVDDLELASEERK